ncbi:MAG: NUDIX hydrolase [Bacteroidota bacterium]
MHREPLLAQLRTYRGIDSQEEAMRQRMIAFVKRRPDCFERSLAEGHLTGAAWIVNPSRTQAVLVLHRKLGKWLQPGGHADGDTDMLAVARREAEEETGLPVTPVTQRIFDLDIHTIPARKSEPEHLHYDVRFLFEAPTEAPLQISHESRDLAWIDLNRVHLHNDQRSIQRLVEKSHRH